ncbi:hypothetical protein NP493_3693g00002 [Ridgeia piscesae]|uniref:Endoribonuclease Regnase 1/ZC3H12 C-terminal domain-containing protein n=1 Tax=Ridgeia piscesae TaxID=27915 RepID=A0AAD9MW64_RIDPI|nr:hypothetical protein NP493_3693g00002 [Ridgeia piscesae]
MRITSGYKQESTHGGCSVILAQVGVGTGVAPANRGICTRPKGEGVGLGSKCPMNHGVLQKLNPPRAHGSGIGVQNPRQETGLNRFHAARGRAPQNIPNLSQPPPAYQGAPPVADVSEKRRNLYFHLCGLFPEDRVIEVMQQHPTETSPQVLCTYLIRMSYV